MLLYSCFDLNIDSISEGGSTKEVLGPDYLGSMLKMETDDYIETQAISNPQPPDLLKMCRNRYETNNSTPRILFVRLCRKPSLSDSPRTTKRRRTLNNTCSASEGESHELTAGTSTILLSSKLYKINIDISASNYDVYESKIQSSTNTDFSSSSSTCRISSANDSNTCSTFQPQDSLSTAPQSIIESNKIEPATPHPPFSQIGIHNHVSLNLHFNNQQQQNQQRHQPCLQQTKSLSTEQSTDSKLVSERFIESLVQRFNATHYQQQQQRSSSHPHTIEYFQQDPPTERISNGTKIPPKLAPKPLTTTAINILSSRERGSSNCDTVLVQPQTNEFKDTDTNSNNNTLIRLTSAAERVLPAFNTFSELKSYLQTLGLDVEVVPASNTANVHQQSRNLDSTQQRLSTSEQQQYQIRSNTVDISQSPQIAMLANNDNNRNLHSGDGKCNRSSKFKLLFFCDLIIKARIIL